MPASTRRRFLLAGISAVSLASAGCTWNRLRHARSLARASVPFQVMPASPTRHLLVVGDSTAVGTGASSSRHSVAGLIAGDHPDWTITNRAVDGATFAAIADQLVAPTRFDLILVMGGGNDVIKLTRSGRLSAAIRHTLVRAHARAPHVICMPAGNVGNAPFFSPPFSWLMTRRAQRLHHLVRGIAGHTGAVYVNLYQAREVDPFAQSPARYHAADGLHPGDEGYALWYRELRAQSGGLL